jgi:4-amino-4-deoxy-L-arabinose transferase-like glycosyltransferase
MREQVRGWCERHGLLLCSAVACLTRFPALSGSPLSVDETWTWYVTAEIRRTGDFWRTTALGVDAPLFVVVNVLVARVAGLSVLGLRAPQALFGALSVALLFQFTKRRYPAAVALAATLLAAWSPFLVFYSRDARPYSQLLFFTMAFAYAFDATRASPPLRRRLLLAVCALLAVASHYFALVFLAAFFAVILAGHARARRRAELREDLATAIVVLVALLPFALALLVGMRRVSVPYWQISRVGLAGILAEQFLLLGTTLPGGGPRETILNVVVSGLLCVPLLYAVARRRDLIRAEPLISGLWWVAPVLVAGAGALLGRNWLFYPRGFISTAPFLLAHWVSVTRQMRVAAWRRRAYAALLLVPFVVNGSLVAIQHPSQPYFRGRGALADVARNVEADRKDYDVVLVHHWWMGQYYYYYLSEPLKVWPLGRGREGKTAALEDLAKIPAGARVLLVVNDLATGSDPDGSVVAALKAARTLVRERPCLHSCLPGTGLVCARIYLFGAAGR